jgi:hypothetical protein
MCCKIKGRSTGEKLERCAANVEVGLCDGSKEPVLVKK